MMDETVCYIDVWHDLNTNSWIIQRKNKQEFQLLNAEYVHSKNEALNYARTHKEENEKSIIRIYKRDGILQKIIE